MTLEPGLSGEWGNEWGAGGCGKPRALARAGARGGSKGQTVQEGEANAILAAVTGEAPMWLYGAKPS